jgi:ABC-2 type transport system ATP-binding protein
MTCNRVQIINEGKLVFNDTAANLDQNAAATSLLLGLEKPPAKTKLNRLPDVIKVETLTTGRFRIHFKSDKSPAKTIAKLATENNWGLIELTPESRNLEQIFLELTSRESTLTGNIEEKTA